MSVSQYQWRAIVGDLERDATLCCQVYLGANPMTTCSGPTLADVTSAPPIPMPTKQPDHHR
jgi:hypothetical protein